MRIRWFVVAAVLFAALGQSCGKPENVNTSSARVLTAVSVTPTAPSMAPVTTLQLRAQAVYSGGTGLDVTALAVWASADDGVANVNSGGVVSAVAAGSTTITATYGGHSESTVLTVSDLLTVAVTPAAPTIARGTTEQFIATGTLQNAATQDLTSFATWGSSDTGVAAVNSAGLASMGTVTAGSTTISATFSMVTGSTTLTSARVASIAVAPASAAIVHGATQQFTATGTLTGGAKQDLTTWATWTSSDPLVATVSNASGSKGLAVSVNPGATQIAAAFDGVTSGSVALTVSPAALTSIAVTPASASVALGARQQFTAIGTYSDSSTQDITASATWFSSNTAVATVDNLTGPKGLASTIATGTTIVTASLSGVTSNAATLTVLPVALVSIDITPFNPNVVVGGTVQFKATGNFSNGTKQDLASTATWNSSDAGVAFISALGMASAQIAGVTTITATSGTITGSTLLSVTLF